MKCDASIKAMLVDIDNKNNHEYIIEELDEEHILVKETMVNQLKARLNAVSMRYHTTSSSLMVTDDEGTLERAGKFGFGVTVGCAARVVLLEPFTATQCPPKSSLPHAIPHSIADRLLSPHTRCASYVHDILCFCAAPS
jgi:hypothetical protein